jgi:hypothetical protein
MDVTNKITGFLQAEGSGKSYRYTIDNSRYILNKDIINIFQSSTSIKATVKIDGENCLIRDKKFYVRYDWRSTVSVLVINKSRLIAIRPIFKNFNCKKLNRFTRKIIAFDYNIPDIRDILSNKIIQDGDYTYKLVSITNASGRSDMLIYADYYNGGSINFPFIFYGDIHELVYGDINPDTNIPEIVYIPDYNINYVDIYDNLSKSVKHEQYIGDITPGSYENISRKKSGKYNYLLEHEYQDNILLVLHGSIIPDNDYLLNIKYPELEPEQIYNFILELFYHTIMYCFGGDKHREGLVFYFDNRYKLKINVGHMRTFLKDLNKISHDFDLSSVHIPDEEDFDKVEKNLSF